MNKLLYNLFIALYPAAIRVVAPFNQKATAWLKGRQNIFEKLLTAIHHSDKVIWMHCASLGEFEQGRPVLEKLRTETAGRYKILLTFFSPSGYEVRKHYEGADIVCYLPMDSPANARHFMEIVRPALVLFVKYDYWYYLLRAASQGRAPVLLISGIFRPDQPFFKWYGGLHRELLGFFTHFFVQNQASANLLDKVLPQAGNVTVAGDTRFDQVIKIAAHFEPIPHIEAFCGHWPVVVAGSTWTEDDKTLDHFANTRPDCRFIIAPHNTGPYRIEECLRLYQHAITYSQLLAGAAVGQHINTLIIDNVGMLSRLYYYATVCYVGGAFGADGVHNVLEAAVYGRPVVFGPEYAKYIEAGELVEAGGALSVDNALDLEFHLQKLLEKDEVYQAAATNARQYVYSKAGSTGLIMDYIQANRLLTS